MSSIGKPPRKVIYPVWAWYMQNGKHHKPDLRKERWDYGPGNEQYVCIEFEIPDDQVLLSDFDVWHIVLCNGLISTSEDEDRQQESYYHSLSSEEQKLFKEKNWENVFDITPLSNDWIRRGEWIQATVWELRKEMIRGVRFFHRKTQRVKKELREVILLVKFYLVGTIDSIQNGNTDCQFSSESFSNSFQS